MKREVVKLAHHRNGVCGMPFYVGIIKDDDGSRKVFIRFPELDSKIGNVMCSVLDIDLLNGNIVGMLEGHGNAWRGDHYSDVIDKAIKKRTELDNNTGLYVEPVKQKKEK